MEEGEPSAERPYTLALETRLGEEPHTMEHNRAGDMHARVDHREQAG
jgi:hypothetical protein